MAARQHDFLDRFIGEIDKAIKVLAAPAHAARPNPADGVTAAGAAAAALSAAERRHSARLMRVNHAGEVSAQALYQGQALTAADASVAAAMRHAAAEETDHLAWCGQRLGELGGAVSRLNPLWYAGSFAIGAVAGAVGNALGGDRVSLGFIVETERQVESHLSDHLGRLPPGDQRSRAILEQMKHDEVHHGATAAALGGSELPGPVRGLMRAVSRVMTRVTYWI